MGYINSGFGRHTCHHGLSKAKEASTDHAFYLISDKLAEGHTVVEQRWNYDDFCNITVRLEEYTYLLIRQVDVIALVRSFRPIPIDEFDNIAQPLI